jgi:hypothetical protein
MKSLRWLWPLFLMAADPYREPEVVQQPEIVPENLPRGLRPPAANFGPDGGIVFPLNPRGIAAAVEQVMPDLQRCSDENPDLYGNAVLRIHVVGTEDGSQASVETVDVQNLAQPQDFSACVLSALTTIRFDHPVNGDEYIIDYPISFSPPDAGPAVELPPPNIFGGPGP